MSHEWAMILVVNIRFGKSNVVLKQSSLYPFDGTVSFEVLKATAPAEVNLKLVAPSFTGNQQVTVNGRFVPFKKEGNFIVLKTKLAKGTKINLSFTLNTKTESMVNAKYPRPGFYTINYGPLLLGYKGKEEISFDRDPQVVKLSVSDWLVVGKDIHLSPVYHLLNPEVKRETGYARQVLFKIEDR